MGVSDASEATEVATRFVRQYYPLCWPKRAERQDDVWRVEINFSIVGERIGWVEVDARTGQILRYELPG